MFDELEVLVVQGGEDLLRPVPVEGVDHRGRVAGRDGRGERERERGGEKEEEGRKEGERRMRKRTMVSRRTMSPLG